MILLLLCPRRTATSSMGTPACNNETENVSLNLWQKPFSMLVV